MNILITGASGLIGTALTQHFQNHGHTVFPMIRSVSSTAPFSWHPETYDIQWDEQQSIDIVIHLAGVNIGDKPWTAKRKQQIINSRVHSTKKLTEKLMQLENKPSVFICASAIGFYGASRTNRVDESSTSGAEGDFLAEIVKQWELASEGAQQVGIRTINMRTGIVLSKTGGALKKMLLPFQLGLGGKIGHGQQAMSWVSLREVVNAVDFMIQHPDLHNAVNVVSPNAVNNETFVKTLGKVLKRPTLLPMPALMVKLLFGEMGEKLLLEGVHVEPSVLQQAGYEFIDPTLERALQHILK